MTYAAALKVTIRLTYFTPKIRLWRKNHSRHQGAEVFYGDIPVMTENGTFYQWYRGVIVQQLTQFARVFESAITASYSSEKIIPVPRIVGVEFEYGHEKQFCTSVLPQAQIPGSSSSSRAGKNPTKTFWRTFYQFERISLLDKDLSWNIPGIVDRKNDARDQESTRMS